MILDDQKPAPLTTHGINEVMAELVLLQGWGKPQARRKEAELWKQTAEALFPPEIVRNSRPGNIRAGKLTVYVNGSSAIVQEMNILKRDLIARWNQIQKDLIIKDIVFRRGK